MKPLLPRDSKAADLATSPDGLVLALIGLPADVAEPVRMLAEILGWRVLQLPAAPVASPAARLCIAMLPADESRPPWAVWSADNSLNEHICGNGLSILDYPPCLTLLESLLSAAEFPQGRGHHSSHASQAEQQPDTGRSNVHPSSRRDFGVGCTNWPIVRDGRP